MKEIDEARAESHNMGASRMMPPPQSVPKVRPNYRIAPKPAAQQNPAPQVQVQAQSSAVAASSPGMSSNAPSSQPIIPQARQNGFSENMQASQPAYSSFPNNNNYYNNTTMGMMNINPFMFNPYIYPAHGYFNDTSQYEEFLKVQVIHRGIKLAWSESLNQL